MHVLSWFVGVVNHLKMNKSLQERVQHSKPGLDQLEMKEVIWESQVHKGVVVGQTHRVQKHLSLF